MERLAKQTKRKDVVLDPYNVTAIEGREATVLSIPAIKQVTITFLFKDAKEAEALFDAFKAKD